MDTPIWRRLRLLRERRGILSKDMAEALGISRSHYALLEGGKRRLFAAHVEAIAHVLRVSVGELYGETPVGRHLRPVNAKVDYLALRRHIEPLLGADTDAAMHCIRLLTSGPAHRRARMRALLRMPPEALEEYCSESPVGDRSVHAQVAGASEVENLEQKRA